MRWITAFVGWALCWTTILGGSVTLGGWAELFLPKNRAGTAIVWVLSTAGLIGGGAIVVHIAWDLPDKLGWQATYHTAFRRFFTTAWGWSGLAVSAAGLWTAAKIGRGNADEDDTEGRAPAQGADESERG